MLPILLIHCSVLHYEHIDTIRLPYVPLQAGPWPILVALAQALIIYIFIISDATAQLGLLMARPRILSRSFGFGPWAELIVYG